MSQAPAFSVLMPCFNAGPYLEAAISSIVLQSFKDWEMIIVDDASTDGSVALAKQWAGREHRIRIVENSLNKGQTRCLNQGLSECRGRWVARQDADDVSHPLRLARQFEVLSSRPEIVLLGTAGRMIDANNRLVGLLDVPFSVPTVGLAMTFLNPILHTSAAFHREIVLREFNGYDESFRIAQDYDLWQRIVQAHPAANLSARLVSYRHLPTSLSKTGASTAFEEAARVASSMADRIPPESLAALTALREGSPTANAGETTCALENLGNSLETTDQAEWRRYSARLILRACGSGGSSTKLRGLGSALRRDPWGTLYWLIERLT